MIRVNSAGKIAMYFTHQTENFYCYRGQQHGRQVEIYLPIVNRQAGPRPMFETIVEIIQDNGRVDNAVKENVYERHTELLTEIARTLNQIEMSVSGRAGHFEIPTSTVVNTPVKRKYTMRKKIARKRSTKRTKK